MATTPTPRSYNRILGDMVDTFLSKFGLRQLRVGSPILSVLEAAAMSDARSSQDIFDLLSSQSLDRAEGTTLDRIGNDEDILRHSESTASGVVTIRDSRIKKISTKVYQGLPAPIAGSSSIHVADANDQDWPASGQVYIGRGTTNLEGPLEYTAKTNNGSYWTLHLVAGTTKHHNAGETVVLAQNGNRTIGAGTTVQTPQGNVAEAVQFTTMYSVVIPDGEVEVEGVAVIAKRPGVVGNVPKGAISSFASAPFPGAVVTNPLPFSNGRAPETDREYRERIRAKRASRAKGTDLAIKTAVLGITSPDENKRVASVSLVKRQGYPSTLYLDDGTGYEERQAGVAIEPVNDRALGGERFFRLTETPIAKASVTSEASAPFEIKDSSVLAVKVGGVLYEHRFSTDTFRSPSSATAYEVVASINANPDIAFSARTADSGSQVVLFAKEDENEDIEVTVPDNGEDANEALLFHRGRVYTLRLYRNDTLLSKDGQIASVRGNPMNEWDALSGTETLELAVDGTPMVTYSFSAQDFVSADTGFATMGNHTLEAWAKVINAKVPGITATASANALALTSNAGRSSRARVEILGGTLVSKGMFDTASAVGTDRDYTLHRYTGDICLEAPLSPGDRLTAGTLNTRSFVESGDIPTLTISDTALVYFVVDGDAEIIPTGITGATKFNITETTSGSWGSRYRIAAAGAEVPFAKAQAGDWLIIWDSASAWASLQGLWRIVDSSDGYIEIDSETMSVVANNVSFEDTGVAIVRCESQPQAITIAAGSNYTAASLVSKLNEQLVGALAGTYRTNKLRVRTNSYGAGGDIALVGANAEGLKLEMEPGNAVENHATHSGSVESGNAEHGTPDFTFAEVAATGTASQFTADGDISPDRVVVGLKNWSNSLEAYGNNSASRSTIASLVTGSPNDVILRRAAPQKWLNEDRFYLAAPYAIGAEDELAIVVDGDTESKRFAIPLWRALRPATSSYGIENAFKDIGDGNQAASSLAGAFGLDFNFNDFAVFMRARCKSHEGEATKSILWRYKRFGPEGETARVRYVYPDAPGQDLSVVVDPMPEGDEGAVDIAVALPSGPQKRGYQLRNSSAVGVSYYKAPGETVGKVTLCLGFSIASANRTSNVTTLSLVLPDGSADGMYAITDHGLQIGDQVWVQSSDPNFGSGLKTITAVTSSTISYAELGADSAGGAIGTVSYDSSGETHFRNATPSAIAVGDLIHISTSAGIPSTFRGQTIRISYVDDQVVQGYAATDSGASSPDLSWWPIGSASALTVYSLDTDSCTASAIKDAIAEMDDTCPVTATLLGDGSGDILLSSREELGAAGGTPWYALSDGINWVEETKVPATTADDYTFVFKRGIAADLVSGSDWENEEVRIVPITTDAIVDWLSVPAISGLFSVCEVLPSACGSKVQLASLTPGSNGSVQVQGGGANSSTAALVGSSVSEGGFLLVTIRSSDASSFHGGHWVELQNAAVMPRSGIIDDTTVLSSITVDGTFVFDPVSPPLFTEVVSLTDKVVQVEKQGRFVALVGAGHVDVSEGDWAYVKAPTTPGNDISSVNQGIFRVVRASADGFWIENPNAREESMVMCDVRFFTADSLMPGDVLSINTGLWGNSNKGLWTVESVGDNGVPFGDTHRLKVSIADGVPEAVSVSPGALGTEARRVVVLEGSPARYIKRIECVVPHPTDSELTHVKFDTEMGAFGATAGTVMTALDKLDFPTHLSRGADGYSYSTGLVGEANRVVYGDERDPESYPGVIASGATVNISGPLVKRVQVSLGIRGRLGVSRADVADQVRSAVAAMINKLGTGQPPALSDVVNAASRVNGVLAVTVLAPTYGAGNDLIPVQPYEKPMVLDIEQDVLVSFIGE